MVASLAQSGDSALKFISLPPFADLFSELSNSEQLQSQNVKFEPFPDVEATTGDSVVAVLHSSGSTGLPRPVNLHQKGVLYNVVNQREHCVLF